MVEQKLATLWKKSVYKERAEHKDRKETQGPRGETEERQQVMCSFPPDLHVTSYRRGLF